MVQFTGHPIVDYGRVSLRCMSDDGDDLSTAVAQLSDLLCADPEGTARLYSAYLPNSVFSNPGSSKTREQDIRLFLQTLLHMTGRRGKGNFVCSLCGALCPEDAILHARKDKIPFLLGDINFYPLLASGLSVCALCGLAVVAALPAMMQAASTFLFMHVQDQSALAGIIQRNLSVVRAHALARQLQLHNYPDARSPEAALLRALYELLTQDYSAYLRLERSRYPKTLWSIRSGNRTDDTRINYLSVPHRVLVFLDKLVNYEQQQALSPPFIVHLCQPAIARQALSAQAVRPLDRDGTPNGAWYGHRLYLQEVMQMHPTHIATIERIGIAIANSSQSKQYLEKLRQPDGVRTLARILHQLVAEGALQKEDARILLVFDYPLPLTDLVRAVAYDYARCLQNNVPFQPYADAQIPPNQIVELIERVAQRVAQAHHNLRSVFVSLLKEETPKSIRRTYLRWVSYGWLSWHELLALYPLGEDGKEQREMWTYRDLLAACIIWHARQKGVDTTISEEEGEEP